MKTDTMTMYEACLLHSRADRAIRLLVGRELEPFKITMMQWLLLTTVHNGPVGGMRMTELASALEVTMPQITALMNDLTQLKLAKQKINPADKRSRTLTVTPNGKTLVEDAEKALNTALKAWLKDIPRDDIKTYLQTAQLIADAVMPGPTID